MVTSMVKQNACSEYAFGNKVIRENSIAWWVIRISNLLSYIGQCMLMTAYIVGMAYLPAIIASLLQIQN